MLGIIKVRIQDVIWGYLAHFFSIASGLIILPMILKKLSPEEIGLNYLMLSIAQLVSFVDFGFSPQFGRNVTYIYSGAQSLLKDGVEQIESSMQGLINYQLLATLIQTARWIYRLIAGIVLFVMLTGGTAYVYFTTNGFHSISNSLLIWIIYSCGVFFQIYYSYYSALLTGSGKIMEYKKTTIYSNIIKIAVSYLFLFNGYGLLGVVLANVIYAFLLRYLSYYYYYTIDIKKELSLCRVAVLEKKCVFWILWHNSKKQGVITFSSFLSYGMSMFLAGIYLSLDEVASYGLMIQLLNVIFSVSGVMFTIYQPRFASLRIFGNIDLLRKEVAYTICLFNVVFMIGIVLLIPIASQAILIIGSQATLPSIDIILICAFFRLLDYNFYNLCQTVIAGNHFPFLRSYLYTGLCITIGCYFSLSLFQLKIWGIVLSTGIIQSVYNNWYWPHVILKQLDTNLSSFLNEGFKEIYIRFKRI